MSMCISTWLQGLIGATCLGLCLVIGVWLAKEFRR
jgi:hypothetical protein